jgi:hypothetical protein
LSSEEDTAALVDHIEAAMGEASPQNEIESMVDNIGLPISSINMTYANSGTFGRSDADILISLKPGHAPTAGYIRKLRLRLRLRREFPGTVFGFLPADIVSQILNFGAPTPIDIQISGSSPKSHEIANTLSFSISPAEGRLSSRKSWPGASSIDDRRFLSFSRLVRVALPAGYGL